VAVPLGDLAIWTESRLVPIYAAHARALSAQHGDALDAAAASFAEVGTNLLAAEAAAEASRVHQRGGHFAKAAASAERASRLVGGTPSPRTPALQLPAP
jgi:hypothetical protein